MPVDVGATQAALDELIVGLTHAMRETIGDIAHETARAAAVNAPKRTGTLAASIRVDGPRFAGSIPFLPKGGPRGPGVFGALVGPTTVYGRIREIGGRIPGSGQFSRSPSRWLSWSWTGGRVFRLKSVGVHQRGEHYLLRTLAEMEPTYVPTLVKNATIAIEAVGSMR